jgi:DNA primase
MAFPPAFLDELRARVGLVQVISRRVKLQKAGREWKGCCPFHNEKTPSFYVNEDKGFYHCFGCGAHGDVIRFVIEQDGLPFPEAVRTLAAEAGLQIPEETAEARERAKAQSGLHDVMAAAATWFANQLGGLAGANARRYVEGRGLTPEIVARFGLGFAPDGNKLKSALRDVSEARLLEVGLIGRAEERSETYDRFRNRLIFPIRDPRGRVVGFGGRILGDGQPKYLNSPDTALFDKGRLLYNLDQAGPLARKSGQLIVVEGYMDVIALAQAGVGEVVAPLGTALTEQQLQLLWRVVPEPVLCFDGDAAGQRAALRAAMRALPLLKPGHSLSIMTMPEGEDPDDFVKLQGVASFRQRIGAAEPLIGFLFRSTLQEIDTSTPERRAGAKANLMALAAEIADPEVRRQYQRSLNEMFFERFARSGPAAGARIVQFPVRQGGRKPKATPMIREMRAALRGLLLHPQVVVDHAERVVELPLWEDPWSLLDLRQAIMNIMTFKPELDSAGLHLELIADGHGPTLEKLASDSQLDFFFNFPGLRTEDAGVALIGLIDGLSGLFRNWSERIETVAKLRELQHRPSAEGDDAIASRLLTKIRDLHLGRQEIYERLYELNQWLGPTSDMRTRLFTGPSDRDAEEAKDRSPNAGEWLRRA